LIRAVIDTNITVSGLLFGGIPLEIIRAALACEFTWVTSPALMEETRKVLRSEKFGLPILEIKKMTRPLFEVADIIIPAYPLDVIKRCPADNRVLECSVEGECSLIVTGDRRDLLTLKRYKHIEIINAREFLNRI
jgi:putative PIN family toxin of toxin-antitoxin system